MPLHNFNPIRIKYVKKTIIEHFRIKEKIKPLENLEILDIGCGGGLLSEPLFNLGGNVTGIDASETNIKIAKIHSTKNSLKIDYFCASPENFKTKKKFDIILNMEIVEHVKNIDSFIFQSSRFLKKDGLMFIATLNKTLKSYLFAILGAEYILKWLPIGTHDWNMFVKPSDLLNITKKHNLNLKKMDGMKFNLLLNQWDISKDNSVNYISVFNKN
tara:strand:- start:223 stop:867 length:645 start_codon:yes stop_codon:yes gene_type:complete